MLVEIGVAVVSGFIGAMLREHVVKSFREYKSARKKIAKDLVKYAHLISNPGSGPDERMDEARYALRDDAAELRAVMDTIPSYIPRRIFMIPSRRELEEVEGRLMRISNSIHSGDVVRNDNDRRKVRTILNLRK